MADAYSTQVMANGPRNLIIKLVDVSDGTGLAGVTAVDATSSTYAVQGQAPGVHLKVKRVVYDVHSMAVRLQWHATTPVDLLTLSGFGTLDWSRINGLPNPNAAGADGSILITTIGAVLNSTFSIDLEMTKGVPNYLPPA